MAENVPEYYPAMSVHLSRVMDNLGLKECTIKRRRAAYLISVRLESMNIFEKPGSPVTNYYIFGSQIEGSTTPGLKSDVDFLLCSSIHNAIQDWSEWVKGKFNVLLLQENTAPGHRRLQVLASNLPWPIKHLPNERYVYDGSGRVLMKSTAFKAAYDGVQFQVNGPALSVVNQYLRIDKDYILAIKCSGWPGEAREWKRRYQTHPTDWITLDLIQKAEAEGFFLVPVGYKLSATPEIEWRVSLSYTERLLMFNMNVTMLKCYTVLKMIVKTFITPQTGKTITSYHCKTALFHCIDHTGKQFWREKNLIYCIQMCLHKLKSFLENGNCVHFIISEVNLFDGKITQGARVKLLGILNTMIESQGKYLLTISIDLLGRKLQSRLYYPNIHKLDSSASAYVACANESSTLVTVCNMQMRLILWLKDNDSKSSVGKIVQILQKHREEMGTPNQIKRRANTLIVSVLSTWIGSILLSISLSFGRPILNVVVRLFKEGTTYFITSYLKLASAFYISGQWLKADSILRFIDERFQQNPIITKCCCNNSLIFSTPCHRNSLYKAKTLSQYMNCFATCVIFTQQDMYCAPPALRNEMYRSIGDDMCHRDPVEHWWMDFAVVDSLSFLYYLQYLTYGQLGKQYLQKHAIQNFDACLKTKYGLGHLETGWNLLGQCMEQERDHYAAMACYQTSLEIRPRNNAANWHIEKLQYRKKSL